MEKTNEQNDGKPIGQNIRAMLTGKKTHKRSKERKQNRRSKEQKQNKRLNERKQNKRSKERKQNSPHSLNWDTLIV